MNYVITNGKHLYYAKDGAVSTTFKTVEQADGCLQNLLEKEELKDGENWHVALDLLTPSV